MGPHLLGHLEPVDDVPAVVCDPEQACARHPRCLRVDGRAEGEEPVKGHRAGLEEATCRAGYVGFGIGSSTPSGGRSGRCRPHSPSPRSSASARPTSCCDSSSRPTPGRSASRLWVGDSCLGPATPCLRSSCGTGARTPLAARQRRTCGGTRRSTSSWCSASCGWRGPWRGWLETRAAARGSTTGTSTPSSARARRSGGGGFDPWGTSWSLRWSRSPCDSSRSTSTAQSSPTCSPT